MKMIFVRTVSAIALLSAPAAVIAFAPVPPTSSAARYQNVQQRTSFVRVSSSPSDDDIMRQGAEQMKNMKPEDIEKMMEEMENMGAVQKQALKAMGMEPELMLKSMKMMRDNPSMMTSAQKMMENMTPEQLMEQSRTAQAQMANMDPKDVEAATEAMERLSPDQIEAAAEQLKDRGLPGGAGDPIVLETMYRTAELMSRPPTGGVTFQGFATLPPIVVLSGNREEDLSAEELKECWVDGSNGASRVDRAGFEAVWNEVKDYFEGDIMEESRQTASKREGPAGQGAPADVVGANLSPVELEAINARVKEMSEDDVGSMLEQMSNLTPEQEARMKAMGADPEMMSKAAKMMADNPMMKKAAASMMKNMTPEQMKQASEQAQRQMQNMTEEDKKKAMENIQKMENSS